MRLEGEGIIRTMRLSRSRNMVFASVPLFPQAGLTGYNNTTILKILCCSTVVSTVILFRTLGNTEQTLKRKISLISRNRGRSGFLLKMAEPTLFLSDAVMELVVDFVSTLSAYKKRMDRSSIFITQTRSSI